MKKVKIVRITDQELDELTKAHKTEENPQISLEDLINQNKNQTISVLRQIKNIYEWKDIEKMVEYVAIMKQFDTEEEYADIDNDQYKVAMEVFKGAVGSGKIAGFGLEKIVQIYSEFLKAQ
jgi:replicative superfamily II helicase